MVFCDQLVGQVASNNLAHARWTQHALVTLQPPVLLFLLTPLTTATGAFLQYDSTVLNGSPPNVTLTVGESERVYCVQPTGPVPTAIEWYNPQGQLVSNNTGDEVNQGGGGSMATLLSFQSYQRSQGGKYECRVTGPGDNSQKLSVCIGECYTGPWVAVDDYI